jgi:uncharacterized protein YecT (DUF1311 family)
MKMKRIVPSVLLIACLLPIAAASNRQKQDDEKLCKDAQTQFEMNQCAHKKFVAADAELNKAYNRLASKLEDEELRAHLKTAELAWIKYRDATCDFEGIVYKGGTMRPMVESFCLARVTSARAAELKEQYEDFFQ